MILLVTWSVDLQVHETLSVSDFLYLICSPCNIVTTSAFPNFLLWWLAHVKIKVRKFPLHKKIQSFSDLFSNHPLLFFARKFQMHV